MTVRRVTIAEIKAYRVKHECSLTHARRVLIKQAIGDALVMADTIAELCEIITVILDLI
jgi:hypothetical protein